MNNKPHNQQTKDKIRAKLLGRTPCNKGIKTNKDAHNKLPTKIILCKCCMLPFEVRITSKQIYAKGHYQKLINSENNPCTKKEVKEKIRKTLSATYKLHPEILENRKASGINQYSGSYSSIEKTIADCFISLNVPFNHNQKIGRYFADFVIFNDVIIECDGEYWHKDIEKDARRDSLLMDKGYSVFRFSENRIKKEPMRCVEGTIEILQSLGHKKAAGFQVKDIRSIFNFI